MATECPDNPGTSVTNFADTLFPRLIAQYLPGWLDQAEDLTLIEHYPGAGEGSLAITGTYDQVSFTSWRPRVAWQGGQKVVQFGKPVWRRIAPERVRDLLGEG